MSGASGKSAMGSLAAGLLADRRFTVAACVLAVLAACWSYLSDFVTIEHAPVPWASGVIVDAKGHMSGLPEKMGPYEITRDLNNKHRDGSAVTAGDLVLSDDIVLQLLDGSPSDAAITGRSSNWYVSRFYQDSGSGRVWQLDVTYYTGKLYRVAHVPGRCMVAAGGKPLEETNIAFSTPAGGDWSDWSKVEFRRAPALNSDNRRIVQYYTFCMNGRNQSDWKQVRAAGANPWGPKYFYFAKIQMTPLQQGDDRAIDAAAQQFVSECLPAVLKTLPTARDVSALNEAYKKRGK